MGKTSAASLNAPPKPLVTSKLPQLRDQLARLAPQGIALAFSGGVDSSVLLVLLQELHARAPFPLLALYASSPMHPGQEQAEVIKAAAPLPLIILEQEPLQIEAVRYNTRERCYHCKHAIFNSLKAVAQQQGCLHLVDGTNADDLSVYRPGRKALQELGVLSPLAELGITKAEVRAIAAELGLPQIAAKPSAPCLATRFDYDTELTPKELSRVERGEAILRALLGPATAFRLRVHNPHDAALRLARIEVPPATFPALLTARDELIGHLPQLGYRHTTIDLCGFRSRSLDESSQAEKHL